MKKKTEKEINDGFERVATIEVFKYQSIVGNWNYIASIDDHKGFLEGEVDDTPKKVIKEVSKYIINDNLKKNRKT